MSKNLKSVPNEKPVVTSIEEPDRVAIREAHLEFSAAAERHARMQSELNHFSSEVNALRAKWLELDTAMATKYALVVGKDSVDDKTGIITRGK